MMARAMILVFVALWAMVALIVQAQAIQRCDLGTVEANTMRLARGQQDFQEAKAKKKAKVPVKKAEPIYELPVVFHVIMNARGTEGFVPLDSIEANIKSANEVYSGAANTRGSGFDARIRLFLAGVTYSYNDDWFYKCSTEYSVQADMKSTTALSPATTINMWTCNAPTLLGWVLFLPYELPQWSYWNGVHLNYKAFPSSKTDPSYENYQDYSDGDTLTHELGHALGLLHTFGNGVTGCVNGDNVDDTPAEASPSEGRACLASPARNTCPDQPGVDPVWNIMDYSDDYCAQEFTPGQVDVMRYSIEKYKPNLLLREPLRCVADGLRGPAKRMTVCKSECFTDQNAPDGRAAPVEGWCRTDNIGNWASCCCGAECFAKSQQPFPVTLSCGRKQTREELLKSGTEATSCIVADIGGGPAGQARIDECNTTPFSRWVANWDGTFMNVGTNWCLSVLNYENANRVAGKRVGLAPCVNQSANQKWTLLSEKGAPSQLKLAAAPTFCVDVSDGTLQMRSCDITVTAQTWRRFTKSRCGSLTSRAACVNAASSLGCSCRWMKGKCIN